MTTLANVIKMAAGMMGRIALVTPSPKATSGTTAVLNDTTRAWTADQLINGTLLITRDAGGAGAAPEGEMQRIDDNATTSITVDTAFSAAIAAGDEAIVIRPKYPMVEWRRQTDSILKRMGTIAYWDTSLSLSAGVTEYTLPAATKGNELRQVWRQTDNTSSDYHWVPVSRWTIQPAAPGSTETLRLYDSDIVDGYSLGLVYDRIHPDLTSYTSSISENIPLRWIAAKLTLEMLYYSGLTEKTRPTAEKILAELNDYERKDKISKPSKQTRYLTWGSS